jgi:hypothetical protein
MTRTTNARIAGFTYLFYAAVGICSELLMHRATSVDGDSAKLARIGEQDHAINRAEADCIVVFCFAGCAVLH